MEQKKPFKSRSYTRSGELSKKEKAQLAEIAKKLKLMNVDFIPTTWDHQENIDRSELIRFGQQERTPKFIKDQQVVWKGVRYFVGEIVPPEKFESHLRSEFQEHGYGLREFNGRVKVFVNEADIMTVQTASRVGLLEKGV